MSDIRSNNNYKYSNTVLTFLAEQTHDLPNSPENQFARCLLVILGVKLMILSVSVSLSFFLSPSGECDGTVLLRERLGIAKAISLCRLRKLVPFVVREEGVGVGVESLVDVALDVVIELRSGELSNALMVTLALNVS
jgi:hypothetical protein